ncbi:MAG: DNA mismatch repair endonuclease MutL [Anaerococcus sp.]|uniref:DNA mismatch repair endonuclease MutL n=1 Tax=Anaerococcus sp. TaxID=1872515 RepID=UPI00290F33B7|nr:DNA mismatch repair endonuclease MutL [Anaerococcus sp.]MDU4025358.1 DNA mismatch repair endonuclease MutL [Anaerococcus sp.]
MPIMKLDNRTIEQIAAGEVIESPVSVVKELVENSIDAGAKNIVVEIKKGGKSYIRVTDDGVGIANDQMSLAFQKHTTSKIKSFSDLYDIYSLGFRGEALSSIASVSHVLAISKSEDDEIGKKLEIKNTNPTESSIATNNGTSIEVMDLFNNVPVRKKFLKSDIAESNAVSKLMYSLAIAYNNTSIKYIKDGRVEFKTISQDPLDIKIANLLDDNLKDNLIEINDKNNLYQIEGYVCKSNYYRASRLLQYIYVNNRLIDSSIITKTIEKQYRSFIPQGRFPAFFIFINTNPKNIDVNVHPNKKTIKFSYEDELLDLIDNSIYKVLNKNLEPNKINLKEKNKDKIPDLSNYQNLLDNYSGFSIVREEKSSYEDNNFFDEKTNINVNKSTNNKDKENINNKKNTTEYKAFENTFIKSNSFLYLTNIFDRYTIFKTNENKIYIMDNRRADQALKFSKYISEVENSKPDSQILLQPLIIKLRSEEKSLYNNKMEFILSLGFDIEVFGENQLIVRAVPQIFEQTVSENLIKELIDMNISSKSEFFYKDIYKLIKQNSFRKGDRLNKETAEKLIDDLFKLDNPFKSYDGKTVILEIEEDTLEKYFDR